MFTPRTMRVGILMVGLGFALVGGAVGGSQGVPPGYGFDLKGEPVRSLAASDTSAVVLFFAASDCPISNRYLPEVRRLEERFAAQHVVVWFVYPNVGETREGVKQHEAAYGHEEHVVLDPDHRLVALAHARVTPEAAILVPERDGTERFRTVFHGRIDNRYLSLGRERPQATEYDLERAVIDVLQHRAVEQGGGPAVGCGIIGRP